MYFTPYPKFVLYCIEFLRMLIVSIRGLGVCIHIYATRLLYVFFYFYPPPPKFDLPWFGGHMVAILRRWALPHHCGRVNLKVFRDILYVGLGEAHST